MIKLIKKFFEEEFDFELLRILLLIIAVITIVFNSFCCGLFIGFVYLLIEFRAWLENELENNSKEYEE